MNVKTLRLRSCLDEPGRGEIAVAGDFDSDRLRHALASCGFADCPAQHMPRNGHNQCVPDIEELRGRLRELGRVVVANGVSIRVRRI